MWIPYVDFHYRQRNSDRGTAEWSSQWKRREPEIWMESWSKLTFHANNLWSCVEERKPFYTSFLRQWRTAHQKLIINDTCLYHFFWKAVHILFTLQYSQRIITSASYNFNYKSSLSSIAQEIYEPLINNQSFLSLQLELCCQGWAWPASHSSVSNPWLHLPWGADCQPLSGAPFPHELALCHVVYILSQMIPNTSFNISIKSV